MMRGDVVIAEFPYTDGRKGENRPALVVQNDRDNVRMANTIIAMISGNVRHAQEPAQTLVDPDSKQGASSGLHGRSVVKCASLYTVRQQDILRIIGHLDLELQASVDRALKSALGLS
ncbi:MAG: type II toxin-antitoxin system PemK/MazF family toxin [Pirellulales bacterium]